VGNLAKNTGATVYFAFVLHTQNDINQVITHLFQQNGKTTLCNNNNK